MLQEIFKRFPKLDGLVIRVGETYLQNTPYHTGNGPIPRNEKSWEHNSAYKTDGGEKIHSNLINLLREEVCIRQNKKSSIAHGISVTSISIPNITFP